MSLPTLETPRLLLRPFTRADAPEVQRFAGDPRVAATTTIPHPYQDGMAEDWIASHAAAFENGQGLTLAVTRRSDERLVGAIEIRIGAERHAGELGYWIGVPYWGKGYATEAAAAMMAYGFRRAGLYRIQAKHFGNNPASGQVMRKIGMTYEGTCRAAIFKHGQYLDLLVYALLKPEWERQQNER